MKLNTLKILFYACMFSMVTVSVSQARDVTLQWDPSTDTSVAGYKINYVADSPTTPFNGTGATQGVSPYDAKKVTSTTLNGLDPAKTYYFAVTAYNAAGTESPYSNIVSVSEAVSPTVSITAPASGSTISGTVSVTASATDNVGVTKVEYYLNGVLKTTDTATPYVYSLNTTSLATGTYTLMAKAYDAAGNVGQSSDVSVSVVNDTTAPTVSLTSPASNTTVNGTVAIKASASDNVGVSKVEFYANGSLLTATNVAPYSYNWSTSAVANGAYTLTAKAYDNTGNVSQSGSVTVTVNNSVTDTIAPTVSITAPANNATVSGTASVSTSASDNVGVTRVEFYVNGVLQATDTASPYSFSWNTTVVTNGSYILTAKAYDAAGNAATSNAAAVTVLNQVAQTESNTIWSGTTVPGVVDSGPDSAVELGVKFRSDVSGNITGVRFYKAGTNTGTHIGNLWDNTGKLLATATFTNETASGWQTVNFATPVEIAANTVYVASYHTNAGHYSCDQGYFSGKGVDTTPLHALADGISGYSGTYMYGTASSFPNQGWNSSNYWVDVAFTASSAADTSVPTVAISSPSAGTTVSGTTSVSASATDNVGVSKVEFYVNNVLQATDTTSPYNFSWNTSSLTNGSYNLTAKGYDAAGNMAQSSSVSVTVNNPVADLTAPSVAISSPTAAATVSGTVTVNATASDNVGVTKVEFYINNTLQATDTASPYTFSWNTTTSVNGTYSIIVNAYDAAGNVGQSSAATVTVNNTVADTTAPTVSVTVPANNATVSGTVSVTASATDNVGVSKVEFYVNNVLQATDTASPYNFSWNTAVLANGTYALTSRAYDAAGNVGQSATVTVFVNNQTADTTPPSVQISYPSNNSKVRRTVTISASATDNVGVTRMELYIDNVLKTTSSTGSLSWKWSTYSYASGTHTIKVTAYDAANNMSSQSISVYK